MSLQDVAFLDLANADLRVDAIYRSGRSGNAGDDPFPALLGMSNQGGFRYRVDASGDLKMLLLTTNLGDPDWPDALDPETGIFTYFGDNIRSRDTKPEIAVRRAVHATGMRFRLHRRDLPGKPDLVFPAARVAVFVHGCFWHRHAGCRNCTVPKSRTEFWLSKFKANTQRDQRVCDELQQLGWLPTIIWECETEDRTRLAVKISELRQLCHTRAISTQ